MARKKFAIWVDTELSDDDAIEALMTIIDRGAYQIKKLRSLNNAEEIFAKSYPELLKALKVDKINVGKEEN